MTTPTQLGTRDLGGAPHTYSHPPLSQTTGALALAALGKALSHRGTSYAQPQSVLLQFFCSCWGLLCYQVCG